jgi:hypothetical protein
MFSGPMHMLSGPNIRFWVLGICFWVLYICFCGSKQQVLVDTHMVRQVVLVQTK